VSLDAETGKPRWTYQASGTFGSKGIWSSPCHHDGRIYFGAYNGDAFCLDSQTGAVIWQQNLCEWIGSSPVVATKQQLLIIGLEYERPGALGSIAALSLETGEKVWENWLTRYQHGSGCYWEAEDLVIIGTSDHEMVALEAATGHVRWSFETRRSVKYAPALDTTRGLVAFASFDKSIYILDALTGQNKFEVETENICYTTPLFDGQHLFCGSGDRHMYVINVATMQAVKRIDVKSRVFSSPRLIGNKIIFGTCGGLICEMDPGTLKIDSVWRVPDAVTNAIVASDDGGTIYVPTYMNEIYAYARPNI
jgi:outer membrane protein assembly factor BamB